MRRGRRSFRALTPASRSPSQRTGTVLAWLEAPDPYAAPLPAPFDESTTRFSKLIAIRALRDEQQLKAVKNM